MCPILDKKLLVLSLAQREIETYVINLAELGVTTLIDLGFAHGYYLPTLLLLHESRPTWTGYPFKQLSVIVGFCWP